MLTDINERDLRDWIVAYRDQRRERKHKCRSSSFELSALTRLGQLAGLFEPYQPATLPLTYNVNTRLALMFNCDFGPELSISASDYSNVIGLKLKIATKGYVCGDNYDLFAREMGKFMDKLPLGGVGSLISATVLDAICVKMAPEAIRALLLKNINAYLTGDERFKAERLLPILLRKCVSAVMECASQPQDPYLLELEQVFDKYLLEATVPDQLFMPTFGL